MAVSHPIYINVYDLTEYNKYMIWFGIGIFHSGLEVHGVEYAFGAHDYPTSGVFEVEPRNTPGFTFRGTVLMGTTALGPEETRSFVEEVSRDYNGDTYNLIAKNCNHFTDDLSTRLVGKKIPGYINRLAWIGWLVNCILPEGLRVEATRHTPEYHVFDEDGGNELSIQTPGHEDHLRLLTPPTGVSQSKLSKSQDPTDAARTEEGAHVYN